MSRPRTSTAGCECSVPGWSTRVFSPSDSTSLARCRCRPTFIRPRCGRTSGRFVDFDGDGKLDLVVGVGDWTDYGWDDAFDAQGRLDSRAAARLRLPAPQPGSNDEPQYERPRKIEAGGKPIDTFGMPSPNFADFDRRRRSRSALRRVPRRVYLFRKRRHPVANPSTLPAAGSAPHGQPLAMDLEMIVPVAIDWDADGDVDLIVGDEDGRVALVENTGPAWSIGLPQFLPPRYFQQEADDVKCGALATPVGVRLGWRRRHGHRLRQFGRVHRRGSRT